MHQLSPRLLSTLFSLIVHLAFLTTAKSFAPSRYSNFNLQFASRNADGSHGDRLNRQACRFRKTRMLFSVPDFGNLLFAPSERRFFNPIWFPYFARPTNVEKIQIPAFRNPLWRSDESDMWMFEQPIGFLNITVNIRSVYLPSKL